MNSIIIHGRLVRNPILQSTASGVSVCRITVAVDRTYKNADGEKQADFFEVICWRGLSDLVSKYFTKGKEIVVQGEMQCRKWQDKDSNNRYTWELMANNIDFCGGGIKAEKRDDNPQFATTEAGYYDFDDESDIPF